MEKKYILTLTFEEQNHFFQKLKNFKKRNSFSQEVSSTINLPLIAPFSFRNETERLRTIDMFEEEISSFFIDSSEIHSVTFTGLDVYEHYKKFLLYLNPRFSIDFYHCIESLKEIKKKNTVSLKKKEAKNPYLLMGKFNQENNFKDAYKEANNEFWFPVDLNVKSIVLLEKNTHQWNEVKTFIEFDSLQDFSSSEKSLKIKIIN